MNDLSDTGGEIRRRFLPLPRPALWVAVPCLALGLAISAFILAVVHNAVLLILLLVLLSVIFSFLAWNLRASRRDEALLFFIRRFPWSDLRSSMDGDLVKLSGRVSCGNLSLQSSYEKASRCVYTSTLLYRRRMWSGFFRWRLAYSERFATDFHLTDSTSGTRVTVRAGYGSKLAPLVNESVLVNTESKSGSLSLTLVKWLRERQLSSEQGALRLEEGYVKEGTQLTVMGMVNGISDGNITIIPILDPISTGCIFHKLILPMVVDGLIFMFSDGNALDRELGHG